MTKEIVEKAINNEYRISVIKCIDSKEVILWTSNEKSGSSVRITFNPKENPEITKVLIYLQEAIFKEGGKKFER